MQKILSLICCVVTFFLVWGCVAPSQWHIGKTVDSTDIIPLQKGVHKGVLWETFDVLLAFDYELNKGSLNISRTGRLGNHYQGMYTHLRSFDVFMFQVDENDRVIHTVRFPTLSMHRPDDDFKFEKKLDLT